MILGSVAFTSGMFIIAGILVIGAITLMTLKLSTERKEELLKEVQVNVNQI